MTYSIITILFVVLGCIYLYRRSKSKPGLPQVFTKHQEPKMTIDEEYNFTRNKKTGELNELLDKINKSGYDSLSKREKEQLKDLSK